MEQISTPYSDTERLQGRLHLRLSLPPFGLNIAAIAALKKGHGEGCSLPRKV